MAESLLAKDQFYINGSYYNDTEVDQDAVISVKDSSDILNRGDDWLVHVTRFSCDSMRSLAYIVADTSATWSIIAKDTTGSSTHVWDFALDRDYATPHDLISEMNMKGRYMTTGTKTWEVYRFEIDAGGRFRLKMATTAGTSNGFHISYSGSASMNKLLGFEKITPFLRFAPNAASLFCRALEFLEKECNRLNTAYNVTSGTLWTDTNEALIELLNGIVVKNMLAGQADAGFVEPTILAQLQMSLFTHLSSLDRFYYKVGYKGATVTTHAHADEARLPVDGQDCICEYFTIPYGPYDQRDRGPKSRVARMHYRAGHAYNGVNGEWTRGQVYFNDNTGTSPNKMAIAKYPVWNPNSSTWTNTRYVYPYESIPGYWYSGLAYHGEPESVCVHEYITAENDQYRQFTLEHPLPLHVKVGHDMLSYDMTDEPEFAQFNTQRHCVEFISQDRLTVHIDWGFGPKTRADPSYNQQSLYFTDRRIPYQSRSCTAFGINLWYTETIQVGGVDTLCTVVELIVDCNVSVGDTIRFTDSSYSEIEQATAYEVVRAEGTTKKIWVRGEMLNGELAGPFGTPPTTTVPNTPSPYLEMRMVFIDKSKWDKIRWAQDTLRMKMAATTYRYEGHRNVGLARSPALWVNGVQFNQAHTQAYAPETLRLQVERFGKIVRGSKLFADGASTFAANSVTERVTAEMVNTIPLASEEMPQSLGIDFGGQKLQQLFVADGTLPADLLRPMGSGTQPDDICLRFAKPVWWGVAQFTTDSLSESANVERARINAFVKNNPNDKPLLRFTGRNIDLSEMFFQGFPHQQYGNIAVSPIITGVASRIQRSSAAEVDNFVVWAPHLLNNFQQMSAPVWLTAQAAIAKKAMVSIQYDRLTRAYQLCKKEHSQLVLEAGGEARLYGEDGDYISSSLMSQIDAIFPYRQIILTSDDLMQIPERSQDVSISQPILSSYTLPTIIPTSVDKEGEASGGTSQPFGTVYFSEGGTRRFHHLNKVQGGMRKFSVRAMLSYKNSAVNPKTIRLQPGGQFTCQLLFVKK